MAEVERPRRAICGARAMNAAGRASAPGNGLRDAIVARSFPKSGNEREMTLASLDEE